MTTPSIAQPFPTATHTPPGGVHIPLIITQAMRARLHELGYADEQIFGMTPQCATVLLSPVTITLLSDHMDTVVEDRREVTTWARFVELVTTRSRRPDKAGPGFSAASFKPGPCRCGAEKCPDLGWADGEDACGHRIDANVEAVSGARLRL